ncbi:MAG: hypothetical protein KME42_02745 [Tildeniella nuda ZEHNDER 1965/U140]|jgi:hypothetical protein|nr:hypothetical protein [Tildeniella nuda ZEHNDER 1965/U140]
MTIAKRQSIKLRDSIDNGSKGSIKVVLASTLLMHQKFFAEQRLLD